MTRRRVELVGTLCLALFTGTAFGAGPVPAPALAAKQAAVARPAWVELNPAQQKALAPLMTEWERLDGPRKKKWIEIADRFPRMRPEEQQRMQERMREWVKLTPEQRKVARENYQKAKQLAPAQRQAKWEKYQQLPDHRKEQLASEAASKPVVKKHVIAPATTASRPATRPAP